VTHLSVTLPLASLPLCCGRVAVTFELPIRPPADHAIGNQTSALHFAQDARTFSRSAISFPTIVMCKGIPKFL